MLAFAPALALAATMASTSPAPAQTDVRLVCQGLRQQLFFTEDRTSPPVMSAVQKRNAAYRRPATIELQINSERGRIRLGESMIPAVHTGGRDGWWRLTEVSQKGDFIAGAYQLNGKNTQRVTINQANGRIEIEGAGRYRGVCQKGRAMDIRRPPEF